MNKKILLIGLIIIVISMSIGYALYSTSLKVKGTGNIDSNFNIEVTGITEDKKEGKAVSITNPTYTKTSATFNTKLSREKDNIEYKVEITNKGSIDGKIENITITNPNELIKVETRRIEKGQIIKSGEVLEYIVRVYIPEGTKINEDITSKIEVNTEIIQDDNQIFNEPIDGIEANKLEIESTIEESEYTGIKCTVNAKGNGLRYSYSLDDKTYTEALENNTYIFNNLLPNKRYTVYYKVEDKDGNYVTESKWITTKDITNSIIQVENENKWTRDKKVTITYPEVEEAHYFYKVGDNEYIEATSPQEFITEENTAIYAKIAKDGNITEVSKEITKIDNKNPELSINSSSTTKSITIVGNATDDSGIEKYEYSINDGDYINNGKYNNYTFNELVHNTDYKIKVRVTDKVGNQTEKEIMVKTKVISPPTYTISPSGVAYVREKIVTVTSNCENCTDEYSLDYGATWHEFPSKQFTIKYLNSDTLVTRSIEGKSIVSSTYVITNVDPTLPGVIKVNSSSSVPGGYLACNGQAVSRTTYKDLFAIIGTTYGAGDGSTTFNLPNMNGRAVIGNSSSYALASTGGAETHEHTVQGHALTIAEMPSHNHKIAFYSTTPWETDNTRPENSNAAMFATYSGSKNHVRYDYSIPDTNSAVGGYVGGNGSHNHGSTTRPSTITSANYKPSMQPYMALTYVIRY